MSRLAIILSFLLLSLVTPARAGAYTLELRTDFNGFFPDRFVEVADPAFLPGPEMEVPLFARAAE